MQLYISMDACSRDYSRKCIFQLCNVHNLGNYVSLGDFMTACAPFPWGNQAAMSSWVYAVLCCCLCRIQHFLLPFDNVIPGAGAHHGVWDVKLMLLSPTKACHFQGGWILASQRKKGDIRQQVNRGPKWTWIKSVCRSQGKGEYSPLNMKELWCFFFLETSEIGTGTKHWEEQNSLLPFTSSLSSLVWLSARKSQKASWDLNLWHWCSPLLPFTANTHTL